MFGAARRSPEKTDECIACGERIESPADTVRVQNEHLHVACALYSRPGSTVAAGREPPGFRILP
jgi:hypothetical protein